MQTRVLCVVLLFVAASPGFVVSASAASVRKESPGQTPPDDLLRRVEAARERGDLAGARKLCEEALARDPRDGRVALALAETMIAMGDRQPAEEILARLARALPDRAEPRRALARALLRAGKTPAALSEARRAVRLDPPSVEGQRILGLAALAAGEPAEAVGALERVTRRGGADPIAMRALAAAYALLEDSRARPLYERLVASEPRNLPLEVEFADYLWRERDFEAGNRVMQEVICRAPDNPRLNAHYGVNLAQQSRFEEAAGELEKALDGGFRHADVYFYLGSALWETGRLDEAAVRLSDAARAAPESVDAHHRLGKLLIVAGRPLEALQELEEAARLDPKSAPIQVDLGRANEESGRVAEAERVYRKALELDPDLAFAHYALGTLLARAGRRQEAEVHIARYRASFEAEQERRHEAGARQAELNLGWTELKNGRPESALKQFRRHPDDPEALRGAAKALSRMGRHAEAARSLAEALKLDPESAVLKYELARERTHSGSR